MTDRHPLPRALYGFLEALPATISRVILEEIMFYSAPLELIATAAPLQRIGAALSQWPGVELVAAVLGTISATDFVLERRGKPDPTREAALLEAAHIATGELSDRAEVMAQMVPIETRHTAQALSEWRALRVEALSQEALEAFVGTCPTPWILPFSGAQVSAPVRLDS